jgi:hypothetical protein
VVGGSRASNRTALEPVFGRFPPQNFERGETLIDTVLLETTDFEPAGGPPGPEDEFDEASLVAYVHEGLVRGVWNRSRLAPLSRATAIVAGDGRWIGMDAFQYGKNLFRYAALTPTAASILPLRWLRDEAPRATLYDALWSVSLAWCTTASVASLGSESLARRTLLLLYDMSRLHPRPEIEVRQKDLADMLGVARQTMQPVLKRLEARGLIGIGYGEITIGEPIQLARKLRRDGEGAGPPGKPPEEDGPPGRRPPKA